MAAVNANPNSVAQPKQGAGTTAALATTPTKTAQPAGNAAPSDGIDPKGAAKTPADGGTSATAVAPPAPGTKSAAPTLNELLGQVASLNTQLQGLSDLYNQVEPESARAKEIKAAADALTSAMTQVKNANEKSVPKAQGQALLTSLFTLARADSDKFQTWVTEAKADPKITEFIKQHEQADAKDAQAPAAGAGDPAAGETEESPENPTANTPAAGAAPAAGAPSSAGLKVIADNPAVAIKGLDVPTPKPLIYAQYVRTVADLTIAANAATKDEDKAKIAAQIKNLNGAINAVKTEEDAKGSKKADASSPAWAGLNKAVADARAAAPPSNDVTVATIEAALTAKPEYRQLTTELLVGYEKVRAMLSRSSGTDAQNAQIATQSKDLDDAALALQTALSTGKAQDVADAQTKLAQIGFVTLHNNAKVNPDYKTETTTTFFTSLFGKNAASLLAANQLATLAAGGGAAPTAPSANAPDPKTNGKAATGEGSASSATNSASGHKQVWIDAYKAAFPEAAQLSDQEVVKRCMDLQKTLNAAKFPCGRVDGDFGPLTQAAYLKYKQPFDKARETRQAAFNDEKGFHSPVAPGVDPDAAATTNTATPAPVAAESAATMSALEKNYADAEKWTKGAVEGKYWSANRVSQQLQQAEGWRKNLQSDLSAISKTTPPSATLTETAAALDRDILELQRQLRIRLDLDENEWSAIIEQLNKSGHAVTGDSDKDKVYSAIGIIQNIANDQKSTIKDVIENLQQKTITQSAVG